MARAVVCQPTESRGFSVTHTYYKTCTLLLQWVRRFLISPNAWISLMTFWYFDRFGVSPMDVFSSPSDFEPSLLPPFYCSLLKAWRTAGGCFSPSLNSLAIGDSSAASFSCKSVYKFILSSNVVSPHCVEKFCPAFGGLHWTTTWKQLCFLPLDQKYTDLNWKISHGVLYTAARLSSFGYNYVTACFCGHPLETSDHLFFDCPLACSGIDWIQSLIYVASPLAPSISLRHMLFGFISDEFLCLPRIFSYLLCVCKFVIWTQRNDYRFRSVRPSAIDLIASIKARVKFYLPLFFKCFRSTRRRYFFVRQWGANGTICRVDGQDVVFSSSF